MALSTASLGQLPYMNLARYVPDRIDEPAWHKALSAFLVNSAAGAGRDLTSNIMAPDETKRAIAMGLIPANSQAPGYGSRVMHGPGVSMDELQKMISEHNFSTNQSRQTDQFKANQDREYEAQYGKTGVAATREAEEERHNRASESVEQKRYDEEHADRQNNTSTNATARSEELKRRQADDADKVRHETEYEKDRADDNARRQSLADAQIKSEKDRDDVINRIIPKPGVDTSAGPGNQSNTDPNASVRPSVPGGQAGPPGGMTPAQWMKNGMPGGPSFQPSGGVQQPDAGAIPTATGPGQQGQATPYGNPLADSGMDLNSLLSPANAQHNVMAQSVGQMGGSSLNGIPGNPYSGTGGVSPSPVIPPFQFDPRVMQAAYAYARANGQPQGIGGTPGVGGLPMGFG